MIISYSRINNKKHIFGTEVIQCFILMYP